MALRNRRRAVLATLAAVAPTTVAAWSLMTAASMLAALPTALLVVLQKHLVRGLLVAGLGGR